MRGSTAVIIGLLAGVCGQALAAADGRAIALQGNNQGAIACATCHGENGIGLAAAKFVRLAGLNEAYLAKQLNDFKQGTRANAVMKPIASALTDAERSAVARYYASLSAPKQPAGKPPDTAIAQRGEAIARDGAWEKNVPACFQCHGPEGRGVPPHFPRLAGQPVEYLAEQMHAWRKGERRNDPLGLMKGVAERLSEEDIGAVAAYLAAHVPEASAAAPRRPQ